MGGLEQVPQRAEGAVVPHRDEEGIDLDAEDGREVLRGERDAPGRHVHRPTRREHAEHVGVPRAAPHVLHAGGPRPALRVITVTRRPSKCGGAASANARERRSEGPPGVAQDTISMGRLGKAASSPPGEHAAEASRTNAAARRRKLDAERGLPLRGGAAVCAWRDDSAVARCLMRENMRVSPGVGHREGWRGRSSSNERRTPMTAETVLTPPAPAAIPAEARSGPRHYQEEQRESRLDEIDEPVSSKPITNRLTGCPTGLMKAQELPIATVIIRPEARTLRWRPC